MNFNGLLIGSENPETLAAFYEKLLGAPTYKDQSYSTWMIGSGSVSVGVSTAPFGTVTEVRDGDGAPGVTVTVADPRVTPPRL